MVWLPTELVQFVVGVQRVVDEHVGATSPGRVNDTEHTRERSLLHAAPVRGAKDDEALSCERPTRRRLGESNGVLRHVGVRLGERIDDRGVWIVPQVEPWIHRDAVTADGNTDGGYGCRAASCWPR